MITNKNLKAALKRKSRMFKLKTVDERNKQITVATLMTYYGGAWWLTCISQIDKTTGEHIQIKTFSEYKENRRIALDDCFYLVKDKLTLKVNN